MSPAVVAVVAHPDDESMIAGGTLALAAQAGMSTGVVSLTRGELGPISDPALATREQLGAVRAAELEGAATELALDWAVCLSHPDGELPWVDAEAAARELARLLAPRGVDVVLTFGEDGVYWHPDHAACGRIARLAAQRLDPPAQVYEAVWPSGVMT